MTSVDNTPWDVVIVGGGSAGLSAALVLSRARRRVLVLDSGTPRNRFAPHLHGVLSRDGYAPLDLVADGQREVRAADGVIEFGTAASITRHGDFFELATDDGRLYRASRVVVASGLRDDLPAIPGLAAQWGRGVVACPYCDGYESRGKRIGVLLGSLPGVHKAHMIRAYSPDVTVFTGLSGALPEAEMQTLIAQGIRVDGRMIAAIASNGDSLVGVTFTDGSTTPLDTLFIDPLSVPRDDLLRQLEVERTETPMGSFAWTDANFQTSVPGLFAIGNVINPAALVPIAIAAGVAVAVAINGALVAEDVAAAVSRQNGSIDQPTPLATPTAAEYWENRYLTNGRSWSGNVNAALEREVSGMAPGTALDLGSGEGGDALWLGRNGWVVTAIDIAPAALAIGKAAQQPGDDVTWIAADLGAWHPPTHYDLVTACFLHSTVDLPREQILRRAAEAVAPGGTLLIVGHFGAPQWAATGGHHHEIDDLPTPDDMITALFHDNPGLALSDWTVVTNALVERPVTAPDGSASSLTDSVLTLRRG